MDDIERIHIEDAQHQLEDMLTLLRDDNTKVPFRIFDCLDWAFDGLNHVLNMEKIYQDLDDKRAGKELREAAEKQAAENAEF